MTKNEIYNELERICELIFTRKHDIEELPPILDRGRCMFLKLMSEKKIRHNLMQERRELKAVINRGCRNGRL